MANHNNGTRPAPFTMELDQLKTFLVVAESGTFSRAAILLSSTQPMLSRKIKLLEDELGTELFHRTGRGVVLSEGGKLLEQYARGLLDTAASQVTWHRVPYPIAAAAEKIRQISGKLYGMNSGNAMVALADMWRVIEPGTQPKARNFALNLIGQSNMATIDVWAARMLRRAANMIRGNDLPRIPPVAETGVSGNWNAGATEVTGEFGFGAAVMERVSKMLEKKGIQVTPPDLQAIAWFAEKELWGQKGWTTKTGEGGSFEENIEAFPVERYLREAKVTQIFEGTNQIQRLVISRHVFR